MNGKMSLGAKLVLWFLIVGILPFAIIGGFATIKSEGALSQFAFNQLRAIREIKKGQIANFFSERKGDMGVLMETVGALRFEAINKLSAVREIKKEQINKYFAERKGDMGVLMETVDTLRRESINKLSSVREARREQAEAFFRERMGDAGVLSSTPVVAEASNALIPLTNSSINTYTPSVQMKGLGEGLFESSDEYRISHDRYISFFKNYLNEYGYYDILLIDPARRKIFFSVMKEGDFGTIIPADPANPLREALEIALKGKTGISDLRPYEPSGGQPSQFVAAPVKSGGRTIAILALQISNEAVNRIMTLRAGLGDTGETYLVGPDLLMRSDSFLDKENHSVAASFANPEKGKVDTEAVREALKGKKAAKVVMDYNGNPVLSAFAPVKVGNMTWAVLAEIDIAETFCPKDEKGVFFYEKYVKQYGYYDLLLMDPSGNCFYTVGKEADLGTNLVNGKFSSSNLGSLVRRVMEKGNYAIADFAPYAPSNNEPCAFIAQPIINDGKVEMVVALQLPLEAINSIMAIRAGLGDTGETYLVGPDMLMRSDSFLDSVNHTVKASFANPEKGNVDTDAAREALKGVTDARVIIDYNGNPVLSAWAPVTLGDITWALIAEVDIAEAFCPKDREGKFFYEKYVSLYGYYDLFLINPDGHCFFTAAKESDLNTNFVKGKFSSSNLGNLTRQVLDSREFGMADFAPYAPSNNEPCAFIAQPVINNDQVEMVVALQLSLKAINSVMQQRDGMGKTGESYLVGSDMLMRSDSFLDPENHTVNASFANPSKGKVDTKASRDSLDGTAGEGIIIDYNGNPVLSAWSPLEIFNHKWAIIAEIDESEAFAAVSSMKKVMAGVGVVGIFMILGIALYIARSIADPIRKVIVGMTHGSEQVTSASAEVASSSQQMAEGATEQASSIEEISASLEELTSTVQQNAQNSGQADIKAREAVSMSVRGLQAMLKMEETMSKIQTSSAETAKIIRTIDEIAFQTNLLALNAAVEAARAGEAGKGFAVVAEEVRNLAQRSAEAAKNTSELILGAGKNADEGVVASQQMKEILEGINTNVDGLGHILSEVSAASSEQSQGINQINAGVAQLNVVTQNNAASGEESASASEELSAQAASVMNLVKVLNTLVEGQV
ncbi:MAG: hypothetical protein CVV64_12000 [Candidatus Wallbacteria bacterium HGW-Wallbacteria-1]|uniref:Methyl-accepting transducer domain-containing protein n=1 Tax=Candidatus Wallbacteria bacterium HGW-Wallbacteria-1 TaxID=2013854 RepID=A0A2N1PNH4_9BACT|nr:MAG: hypothetical protein CVV64_12000 [Candidatus Wallbacteria bacterium HGW-Wallbacteria-1]